MNALLIRGRIHVTNDCDVIGVGRAPHNGVEPELGAHAPRTHAREPPAPKRALL